MFLDDKNIMTIQFLGGLLSYIDQRRALIFLQSGKIENQLCALL